MNKSLKIIAMLLCFTMMFAVMCSGVVASATGAEVETTDPDSELLPDVDLDLGVEDLPGMDYAISLIQNLLHRIISVCETVFDFLPFFGITA